jgi:hypothetical protein
VSGAGLGAPIDFVASDLTSRNWWIYNNVLRPNGTNVYQAINTGHGSGEANFWIWNNVFYSVQKNAWPSGDQRMVGTWNGMPTNMTFVHNTIVNESVGGGCNWAYLSAERSDSVIRNNLFYNVFQTNGDSGAIYNGRGTSATISHNYFNVAGCPSGQCTSGGSAIINALNPLVDALNGNYTLKSAMAAINAGYTGLADSGPFTPSIDKNGMLRGPQPDLGAFEFGSVAGLRPPLNVRVIR